MVDDRSPGGVHESVHGASSRVPFPARIHVDGKGEHHGLVSAVLAYEAALRDDDLAALADFFAPGDATLRADAQGLLVGHDAITSFRGARGGVGERSVRDLRLVQAGDDWLAVTINEPSAGGSGVVTQLWTRAADAAHGWRIKAAHVTAPAKAMDARVWRVIGAPLVPGAVASSAEGVLPLAGRTIAVKDLFAIAGQRIGVGSRAYLAEAPVETATAPAVQSLLNAGADVLGIAQTDQFAYSIAGLNPDYGTPPNAAVRGAIPGGSSSGPASAVALGQADIGLGTDTAGSIRVPASYQGLWGLRTTHGAVSLEGVAPLAPRYDTVGWMTRDGDTLLAAATAGLVGQPRTELGARVLVAPGVLASATRDAADAVVEFLGRLVAAGVAATEAVDLPATIDLYETFRITQSAEAWRSDGAWVTAHPGALAPDVEQRFEFAASVTEEQEAAALAALAGHAAAIDAALGDGVLVLPAAASAAPSLAAEPETLQGLREATLGMTAVAGFTGRPALTVPWLRTPGGPLGLCLVGPRGSDLALIELALRWEATLASPLSPDAAS